MGFYLLLTKTTSNSKALHRIKSNEKTLKLLKLKNQRRKNSLAITSTKKQVKLAEKLSTDKTNSKDTTEPTPAQKLLREAMKDLDIIKYTKKETRKNKFQSVITA